MSRKTPNVKYDYFPGAIINPPSESESSESFPVTLLDGDDFAGGAFNPFTGDYLGSSLINFSPYSTVGKSPFESPATAGVPAPPGGASFIGRVQWAVSGSNELQPFVVAGGDGGEPDWDLAELYFEMYYYIPTGFPFCSGKFARFLRIQGGVGVGATIHTGTAPLGAVDFDPLPSQLAIYLLPVGSSEAVDFFDTPRDQWVKISTWAKWNTFTGPAYNADGFVRQYINEVLVGEHTGVVFSTDSSHAAGFNLIKAPLNMSYAACTGVAPVDGAIWVAKPRLYSTKPF